MSKAHRETPRLGGGAADDRLARLLETPFLARVVPHLTPETLHQVMRRRGLHACGELVASATPGQLTSLLDLDLWRHAEPGRDHQFDADRFGEWLEMLADAGEPVLARILAAFDAHLLAAGLSCYVRVFDPGIFEPTAQSDDERPDRHEAMREGDSLEGGAGWTGAGDGPAHAPTGDALECEVGGYLVRARRPDGWDAIVGLLVALDTEDSARFHAVMQGCRRLSNSRPEIDGPDDVSDDRAQAIDDLATARERRRSQRGYVTPADARAFLAMARHSDRPRSTATAQASFAVNPIAAAYFRSADHSREPSIETPRTPDRGPRPRASGPGSASPRPSPARRRDAHPADVEDSLDAVMDLLADAGALPERPRALLETGDDDPQAAALPVLRRLMAYVRDNDTSTSFARSDELAFLANALLAGCSVQSRPFTPREASDAAAATCNLGLEYWPARWPNVASSGARSPQPRDSASAAPTAPSAPDRLLIDHDLVTAFEVGWAVLHQDVSLFAARQLVATLEGLVCVDVETVRELFDLRRTLARHCEAGTPWRARDAIDVLATLDLTVWASVLGLLDECPVLPAALTAILEGHTTAVSPTAFDFISTAAQIAGVRRFTRKLPELLSR